MDLNAQRDKLTRRATHFRFTEIVSSPKFTKIENISLFQKCEMVYIHVHPVPARGAYHDRHERGAGSGGRGGAEDERRHARRSLLAKTGAAYGEVVWS
jgi:hypothetical protein